MTCTIYILAPDILSLPENNVKHDCTICLDGEVNYKSSVSFGVKFFNKHDMSMKAFEGSIKILDFYGSILRGEFGTGSCPHILYKITAIIKDENNNAVFGATLKEQKEQYSSNKNGQAVLWLRNGNYAVSVKKDGYKDAEKKFNVYDGPLTLDITLYEDAKIGYEVIVNVVDESGNSVEGVSVNGVMTDVSGKAIVHLVNGLQTIVVEKEGYKRIEQSVDVKDERKNVVITLQKSEEQYNWGWGSLNSVSLGGLSSAAITTNGDLYTWGYNDWGGSR